MSNNQENPIPHSLPPASTPPPPPPKPPQDREIREGGNPIPPPPVPPQDRYIKENYITDSITSSPTRQILEE